MRFFRLELAVAVSVWLLLAQHQARSERLSKKLQAGHCICVLLFALVGATGVRTAILLFFGFPRFLETFQEPNLLELPSNLLCWFAGTYAVIGSMFFVSVMFLGQFSRTARRAYLLLVIPSTAAYPVIMCNLARTVETIRSSTVGVVGTLLAFIALAVCGLVFYCLPPVSAAFRPGHEASNLEGGQGGAE